MVIPVKGADIITRGVQSNVPFAASSYLHNTQQ